MMFVCFKGGMRIRACFSSPFAWWTCQYLQRSPKSWIPSAPLQWFRNPDNAKLMKLLEQFIWTVDCQNNSWWGILFNFLKEVSTTWINWNNIKCILNKLLLKPTGISLDVYLYTSVFTTWFFNIFKPDRLWMLHWYLVKTQVFKNDNAHTERI